MLAFNVLLITRTDLLKFLMEKLVQDGKIAKWVPKESSKKQMNSEEPEEIRKTPLSKPTYI